MKIWFKIMFYLSLVVFGMCISVFADHGASALLGMISSAVLAYLCAREIEEIELEECEDEEEYVVYVDLEDKNR
jgi:hypothetical protein